MDGSAVTTTLADNNFQVAGTAIIAPATGSEGGGDDVTPPVTETNAETFDKNFDVQDITSGGKVYYNDRIYGDFGAPLGSIVQFGVTDDPVKAGNNVLYMQKDIATPGVTPTALLNLIPETKDEDFNKIVLSMDMYLAYTANAGDKTIDFNFYSTTGNVGNDKSAVQTFRVFPQGGELAYGLHTGSAISMQSTGVNEHGAWFNLRIEYIIVDAAANKSITRVYIDNTLAKEVEYARNFATDVVQLQMFTRSTAFFNLYLDNIVFEKVKADPNAPAVPDVPVTPPAESSTETFDNVDFEIRDITSGGKAYLPIDNIYGDFAAPSGSMLQFGVTEDPKDATNKVLALLKDRTGTAGYQTFIYVTPTVKDANYNAFVFETDIYLEYNDSKTDTAFDITLNKGGKDNYAQRIILGIADGKLSYRIHTTNTITGTNYNSYIPSEIPAEGAWYNFKIEYRILDAQAGKTQTLLYLNDVLVADADYVQNATVYTDLDFAIISSWSNTMYDFYMDNVSFEKIDYTAEDDETPSQPGEGGDETPGNPPAESTSETFENVNFEVSDVVTGGKVYLPIDNIYGDFAAPTGSMLQFGVTEDPKDATNKVLALLKDRTGTAGYQTFIYVTPTVKDANYNAFVFETDIYLEYNDSKTDTAFDITLNNGGSDKCAHRIILGIADGKLSYRIHTTNTITGTNYNSYIPSEIPAEGEWYNFKIEYRILDAQAGKTQTLLYLNDVLVADADYVQNSTVYTDLDSAIIGSWSNTMYDFYMDNVSFEKIVYTAEGGEGGTDTPDTKPDDTEPQAGETFESVNYPAAAITAGGKVYLPGNNLYGDFSFNAGSDHIFGIANDPVNAANKVLNVKKNSKDASGQTANFYLVPEKVEGYDGAIFQADVYLGYIGGSDKTIDFQFYNETRASYDDYSKNDYVTQRLRFFPSNSKLSYGLHDGTKCDMTGTEIPEQGGWFNLKIEYSIDREAGTTHTLVYIDNVVVKDVTYTYKAENVNVELMRIAPRSATCVDMYFDNLTFKQTKSGS